MPFEDRAARPPLAKVRVASALQERHIELVAGCEGRVRELLEGADVVSEGAAKTEATGPVYYGSTHMLLTGVSSGGTVADADIAVLARLAGADPHLRVRALRVAHREAVTRAGAPLGALRAELRVERVARGLAIHVDVAAVFATRARARST